MGVFDYDIALVKIEPKNGTGIQWSEDVKYAFIPGRSTNIFPLSNCSISGWGRTTQGMYCSTLKTSRLS